MEGGVSPQCSSMIDDGDGSLNSNTSESDTSSLSFAGDLSLNSSMSASDTSRLSVAGDLSLNSSTSASDTSSMSVAGDLSLNSSTSESESYDAPGNNSDLGLDSNLLQPLYNGSPLSTWDSYLLIMKYGLRHTLTKQAVGDGGCSSSRHIPWSV